MAMDNVLQCQGKIDTMNEMMDGLRVEYQKALTAAEAARLKELH